jgi:hypothetical protein
MAQGSGYLPLSVSIERAICNAVTAMEASLVNREKNSKPKPGFLRGSRMRALVLAFVLLTPSCLDSHYQDSVPTFLQSGSPKSYVQEGELALRDGDERKVYYKIPFQSPPNLVVVEIRQAWFKDAPFSRADFQLLNQEATFFKIRNDHPESHCGSWATVKWRAEGIRAEPSLAKGPQQDAADRQLKTPVNK